MILNCAIVDDEPLALELLRSYVEKTSFLRLVGRYSSAVQAMTEIPDRKSTRLNSSHLKLSRMPSSA